MRSLMPEVDGRVLWRKLRPFSERLSLATHSVDNWALNATRPTKKHTRRGGGGDAKTWRKPDWFQRTSAHLEKARDEADGDTSHSLKKQRQEAPSPLWTRHETAHSNPRKDFLAPTGIRGPKAAAFTFWSADISLVRGGASPGGGGRGDGPAGAAAWGAECESASFLRSVTVTPSCSIQTIATRETTLWLNWWSYRWDRISRFCLDGF